MAHYQIPSLRRKLSKKSKITRALPRTALANYGNANQQVDSEDTLFTLTMHSQNRKATLVKRKSAPADDLWSNGHPWTIDRYILTHQTQQDS